MSSDFSKLIAEFKGLFGAERIITGIEAQKKYGISTLGLESKVAFGFQPQNREEVAVVVATAARYRLPLYPVSTGKNWGYGSASPVRDGCVILDCSLLNRITGFDGELGIVTLEPGVTQGQLGKYLEENGAEYLSPVTGAGADASIVGNALDRGISATGYSDRFGSILGIKAVLADGTLYESPLSGSGFKWGIGPYLDGLFAQGNFGIVLEATIALAPRPLITEVFSFNFKNSSFDEVLCAARDFMKEAGEHGGSLRLQNGMRVAMRTTRHPKSGVQEKQSSGWLMTGVVKGNKDTIRGIKKTARRIFGGISRSPVLFFNRRSLYFLERIISAVPPLSKYGQLFQLMRSYLSAAEGVSSKNPSLAPLWKILGELSVEKYDAFVKKDRINFDEENRCGLIFYSGIIPMKTGGAKIVAMVESICKKYGREPIIGLHTFSERSLYLSVPVLFDRQDKKDAETARACYRELVEKGNRYGFPLYRASTHIMDSLTSGAGEFWKVGAKIKEALDPDNIIAPGRYNSYKKSERPL